MDLINKNMTMRDPEVWRSPLSLPTVHHSVRRPSVLKPIVSFYQNIFYVLLFLLFTYSILSHPSLVITEEDEDGNKYLFCVAVAHMTDSEMFIVFVKINHLYLVHQILPWKDFHGKKDKAKIFRSPVVSIVVERSKFENKPGSQFPKMEKSLISNILTFPFSLLKVTNKISCLIEIETCLEVSWALGDVNKHIDHRSLLQIVSTSRNVCT